MSRLSIPGPVFLWSAFVCFFLMCFPCGAFAGSVHDALSPSEKAWLNEHPTIRMAPDPDFPPLEFFDEAGSKSFAIPTGPRSLRL